MATKAKPNPLTMERIHRLRKSLKGKSSAESLAEQLVEERRADWRQEDAKWAGFWTKVDDRKRRSR